MIAIAGGVGETNQRYENCSVKVSEQGEIAEKTLPVLWERAGEEPRERNGDREV